MATFVPGRDPDAIVQDSFIEVLSELDEVGYATGMISLLSGADWQSPKAETRRSAMADATISEGMTNVAESKRSDRVEFISVVTKHLTSLREASPKYMLMCHGSRFCGEAREGIRSRYGKVYIHVSRVPEVVQST